MVKKKFITIDGTKIAIERIIDTYKREIVKLNEQEVLARNKCDIKAQDLKEIMVDGNPPKVDKLLEMCIETELIEMRRANFMKKIAKMLDML
jgi:predicted HicB family RNase H-like nuclease